MGRKEAPGRPLLYGTTRDFLEVFGLPDLSALPTLRELGADPQVLMAADLTVSADGVTPTPNGTAPAESVMPTPNGTQPAEGMPTLNGTEPADADATPT